MDENNSIGKEIRRNLYLQGKSQKWLADEVGVAESTISSIICGRSKPSQKTLLKIAMKLSINAERLVDYLLPVM